MHKKFTPLQTVGFAFFGFFFWALSDTTIKFIRESGLSSYTLLGLSGLICSAVIFAYAGAKRKTEQLNPQCLWKQIVRACLHSFSYLSCIIALKHLSLTLFYLLIFSAPLVIVIFAALLLGERLTLSKSLSILTGFLGVLIALDPFSSDTQANWIGYVSMASAVFFFSANAVWLRHLTQSEHPLSVIFSTTLVSAAIGLIGMVIIGFDSFTLPTLLWIVVAALINMAGTFCNILALKYTHAANVSQYHYTQVLVGALMGYLIWDDVPTPPMLLGAVLIIAAGIYMAYLTRQEHQTGLDEAPNL